MKFLLLFLLFSARLFAFADWETESVPITNSPIVTAPDYQFSHDSCAEGNGNIHFAYVIRNGELDTLYYIRKNLYENPGQFALAPQPIVIDIAPRISSVQIRKSNSGTVHFAYNRLTPSGDFDIPFLRHSTYTPGDSIPVTGQNIPVAFSGPYHISLAYTDPDGILDLPFLSMAVHSPTQGGTLAEPTSGGLLSYASLSLSTGDWVVEPVISSTTINVGRNPSLTHTSNGLARIAYDDPSTQTIQYAARSGPGSWIFSEAIPHGGNPSLIVNEDGRHIAYVEVVNSIHYLKYQQRERQGLNFVTTTTIVDTITNPDGVIFPRTFAEPVLVISEGRIVITYRESLNLGSAKAKIAVRHLGSSSFDLTDIPLAPGDTNVLDGTPTVSLDEHLYPIITWLANDNRGLRATYCPDFTDFDKDGVPYLQERAFIMNPNVSDISLFPTSNIRNTIEGRFLELDFRIAGDGTIDPTTKIIDAGLFLYKPDHSFDLVDWPEAPTSYNSFVFNTGPMIPPSGKIQSAFPLGFLRNDKQFLRVKVFRK